MRNGESLKGKEDISPLLAELLACFQPERQHVREVKEWYRRVFSNQPVERLLLSLPGELPGVFREKRFTLREQFHEKEKMFCEHLRMMVADLRGHGALLPALRANLGTGFVPTVFDLEQVVLENEMPWLKQHLSKEEIVKLGPEDFRDVREKGLAPKAREIYEFYIARLGTAEYCFVPDTQGVMDIAHLVRGDELFHDFYDDPSFVHHLMELSLAAYVSVTRYMKSLIGEPLNEGMHAGIAMYNGGVRMCMDTTTLLSPGTIREFNVPYLRRGLQEFGGGWVHFCGYAPHLVDILVEIPEVRGINPNYMVEQAHDYERDIKKVQDADKFFYGGPFAREGETLETYFRRVIGPLRERRGLMFSPRGEGLDLSLPDKVINLWDRVQDDLLPV